MKGRQKGRPTKWVQTRVLEYIDIGKRGIQFEVWEKWKQKERNTLLSDLFYSVLLFGGLALAEKQWPILGQAATKVT